MQTMKMIMINYNNNNKNNDIDSPQIERKDSMDGMEGRQRMGGGSKIDARLPIYVTENGCDVPYESHLSFDDVINDKFR